jgi:hypothetical protein
LAEVSWRSVVTQRRIVLNWRAPIDREYTDWIGLFDMPILLGQNVTGWTHRQTNRQTDKQTNRKTDTQKNRQTDKQTNRHTQTNRHIDTQTKRKIDKQTNRRIFTISE